MTQIHPYLAFDGDCRAAMTFYQSCLGGELTIHNIEGSPAEAHIAPDKKDRVLHASLQHNALVLLASDMCMGEELVRGNGCSISLNCSSEAEINDLFAKLSVGAQITQPLQDQFWGAIFGMFNDQFGVTWMLNFDKTPQQA